MDRGLVALGLVGVVLVVGGCMGSVDVSEVGGPNAGDVDVDDFKIGGSDLPACGNANYTTSPVPIDRLSTIEALGNVNPPAHTIPSPHMYFTVDTPGTKLRAPGNVSIQGVSESSAYEDGTLLRSDYSIRFQLCDGVSGYFKHVKALSPQLRSNLERVRCEWDNGTATGKSYRSCDFAGNQQVAAGTVLGTVGNENTGTFDFGTKDERRTLGYANQSRYREGLLTTACPIEYYEDEPKAALYEKVKRVGEPRCGAVMQDVSGTLQGNWYTGGAQADDRRNWEKQLAFIHWNENASKAMISVGGIVTEPGWYRFTPAHTGTVNREFSEVTPDGRVYCYESEHMQGKIIVEMLDAGTIRIENRPGDCTGEYTFDEPSVYRR